MTTTVFLLRHAAHDNVGRYLAGRCPGVRLGPEGLVQAARLGTRMARERFDALFASPRKRCQETALAVADARGGMTIETAETVDEVDFGSWSGETFEELNKRQDWQRWNACRSLAATPAGDTMLQVQSRATDFLRDLSARGVDGRFAVVSHADVIRAIIGHILGLPIDSWQRFEIAPASLTTIVFGEWGGKVLTLNEMVP